MCSLLPEILKQKKCHFCQHKIITSLQQCSYLYILISYLQKCTETCIYVFDCSKAFNYWLKIPEDKLNIIIEMTQMLHNASLL